MAARGTSAVAREPRRRKPGQLAGGPHKLSREEVERNQTERILTAMRELIGEHGYERTTVDRVIRRAGVSRRTMYELRGGRERWFLAICETAANSLLARIEAAEEAAGGDRAASAAAAALIDFCLDEPAAARACFVETLAANDEARAWRDTLVDRVTATIATAVSANGAGPGAAGGAGGAGAAGARGAELAARAAVGAVLELVGRRPDRLDRGHALALVATLLAAGGPGDAAP